MKKILVFICIVLAFCLGIVLGIYIQKARAPKCKENCEEKCKECVCEKAKCVGNILSYHIFEGEPGTGYDVEINFTTKALKVKESYGCSFEDCTPAAPTEDSAHASRGSTAPAASRSMRTTRRSPRPDAARARRPAARPRSGPSSPQKQRPGPRSPPARP